MRALAVPAIAVVLLAAATDASATTYCVQKPSCVTAGGTNQPDVQTAFNAAAGNPGPDRVELGPTTFDSGVVAMVAGGGNQIDVVGSGAATELRNTSSTVLGLDDPRSTVSNLTLTLQTSNSVALRLSGTATDLTIIGDTGRSSTGYGVELQPGGALRRSQMTLPFAEPSTTTIGVNARGAGGTREIEDVDLIADTGFDNEIGVGTTNIRRLRTRGPIGVSSVAGTTNVEDSVIQLFAGSYRAGINADPARTIDPTNATINASNVTIVGPGTGTQGVGLRVTSNPTASQVGRLNVHSSIITRVEDSADRIGGPSGHPAHLAISYSNFDPSRVGVSGAGDFTSGPGNIFTPPGFVDLPGGNFHLSPTSSAVDAGKPGGGGSPLDVDALPRRVSAARNCSLRRDMGAFEYHPAPRRPIAVAHVDEASIPLGTFSIFSSTSCDPDGEPIVHTWRFGDGTPAGHGTAIVHQFTSRGTKNVTLTVRDSTGRTDSESVTVVVTAARPCVNAFGGGGGPDVLTGTPFGDRIMGHGGADVIRGLGRDDCLTGGSGPDRLVGGRGNDVLKGGAADDRLNGGPGRDRLDGGTEQDRLSGGSGDDRLNGRGGRNTYSAGPGNDRVSAANGVPEDVDCGRGRQDRARVDRADAVSGCETVTRVP